MRILLEGNVKKRGQVNAAYKGRFFVLKDDVLEYYEDKKVRKRRVFFPSFPPPQG